MRATTNNYVRIYANRGTHWDGWDWGDMRSGHHVDVHAFRSHGRWIASTMQNWHEWGNGGWATTTRTLESGTWAARTTAAGMTEVGT